MLRAARKSPRFRRRTALVGSLFAFALTASAGVVVNFNANGGGNLPPVIPSFIPSVNGGTIFDLTPAGQGTTVPAYGNAMAGDAPLTGGPCVGFATGELCNTAENAVVGVRAWETVLQNQSGNTQSFWAGFFAPGLAAWFPLTLPNNGWVYFAFPYLGPTPPLWGVFSTLDFPIVMTTSIVDPPNFEIFVICDLGDPGGPLCGPMQSDPPPAGAKTIGTQSNVPEPGSLPLLALGLGAWAIRACMLRRSRPAR